MDNYEIRKHIDQKQYEMKEHVKALSHILGIHGEHPFSDATISEVRARLSSAMAQCEISIRDHTKLITIIKCHCDTDECEDCYADCDHKFVIKNWPLKNL